jgi:hypothetical protein
MHAAEGGGQALVGQSAQQPRAGLPFLRRRAQRLDEQDLHQAREHEFAPGQARHAFLPHQGDQHRQPLHAPHVHDGRQQRHEQGRIG